MKKIITSMFVGAAICAPGAALANHYSIPTDVMTQSYESYEDCEDALAQVRNLERKTGGYEGRERGQYNKAFNAMYQCEETEDGMYMIEMSS